MKTTQENDCETSRRASGLAENRTLEALVTGLVAGMLVFVWSTTQVSAQATESSGVAPVITSLEMYEGAELAYEAPISASHYGLRPDRRRAEAEGEHGRQAAHGISVVWEMPADEPLVLAGALGLRLENNDRLDYIVTTRAHGDTGTYRSRVRGGDSETLLRAGSARELAMSVAGRDLGEMEHSGQLRVSFEACPVNGGDCLIGTSDPIFFHEQDELTLVYGESVLCERFGCGDLRGASDHEPGTMRVLGGEVPATIVADEEERDSELEPTLELASQRSSSAATWIPMTICVKADIQTTDSGLTANSITEDRWVGANSNDSYVVIGRGFRIKVTWGNWSRTYDTHPQSGCVTFASPLPSYSPLFGVSVRVYGLATDSAGNRVRIHNAQTNTGSWYPGSTYSALWTNQVLLPYGSYTYVLDGRANDRWTTIAAAAYGLYRFHDGNSDATISIGFDEADCDDSGSIHGSAEHYIESDNAHLLRIGRCAGTTSDAREKMLVTHELGHAMLRLYYGYDGDDNPRDQTWDPPGWVNTSSPPQGSDCINVDRYDMNSLEWNSQTFKEAFADFYSTKVWNHKASRATYTYRGIAFDAEVWDNVGGDGSAGGFSENWCGISAGSISTKGDYLRFLWDFYTVAGCASQPSRLDMFRIYRAVRENDRTGDYPLSIWNYDDALENAIENSVGTLSGCEQQGFDAYAAHNGIR